MTVIKKITLFLGVLGSIAFLVGPLVVLGKNDFSIAWFMIAIVVAGAVRAILKQYGEDWK